MQRSRGLAGLRGMARVKPTAQAVRLPAAALALLCPLALLAACGTEPAPGAGATTPVTTASTRVATGTDGVATPDPRATTVASAPATKAFADRARVVAEAVRANGVPRPPQVPMLLWSWAPDLAFDTDEQKVAWSAGKVSFAQGLALPDVGASSMTLADGTKQPVDLIGPREALARALQADSGGDCAGVSAEKCSLTVTKVAATAVPVETTRGGMVVPAWALTVEGLSRVIPVVATAPGALARYEPPEPLAQLPGLGAGFNSADSLEAVSGSTITVLIGSGACDRDLRAHAVEFDDLVVVGGTHTAAPPGTMCTAQYLSTPAVLRLAAPLGDRVVIDVVTGSPRFLGVPFR